MPDRHRSSSVPSVSPSSFRLPRKPAPPPPPFHPHHDDSVSTPQQSQAREPRKLRRAGSGKSQAGGSGAREDLAQQEERLLRRAIEESQRESATRTSVLNEENEQLRIALEASRLETTHAKSPPMSLKESEALEKALALSAQEHEQRIPRASNTPPPGRTGEPLASASFERTKPGRTRSVSTPDTLPPFPFTTEDLVRPSYPNEKSRLFPQGLPSLPPGAARPQDEYEKELEMLTLAIRMSEEEERLRQEREDRELREVVRRVEEQETKLLGSSRALAQASQFEVQTTETASPAGSPRLPKRGGAWFRPPLTSKFASAGSLPSSPPLSPQSIERPGLAAIPTNSTTTSFRTAAESLPFTNLIRTSSNPDTFEPDTARSGPPHPRRAPLAPPVPPHPTRLPPSPPETPVVQNTAFPPVSAPPVPPLPTAYYRRNTAESDQSDLFRPTTAPFHLAHVETHRVERGGSPVEMPYLTPSASNSIRSVHRGSDGRIMSWGLEDRHSSNNSGSGSGSGSANGHSRVNSVNRTSADLGETFVRSGVSPIELRSEEGHDELRRDSYEEGDDGDSTQLSIRNPDSNPFSQAELQHQGRFVSEPVHVDVPRDVEAADTYFDNADSPLFASAYAGRSMSAIDEQTEPASSIIAEEGGTDCSSRQGSYPSTNGTVQSATRRPMDSEPEPTDGGEDMGRSITYHARPLDEGAWMHDAVLPRPVRPPPPPPDSQTPTPPRRDSPPQIQAPGISEQAIFPLPPVNSLLPAIDSSPEESDTTSTPLANIPDSDSDPAPVQPAAFADGTRFGHPSICAREPGHVCPDDGLDGIEREVPETIELTSLLDNPTGLGLSSDTQRRREETGGKRILRDAWAIEVRCWASLLRFLMWYGDTKLVASSQDVALEPTRHCTAAASLEFRPDDEGYTIIRLVITILPPDDPDSQSHRELTVEHPAMTPPAHHGKGKGRAKSYFSSSSSASAETSTLATFHLPDSVHLPCRFSNLAIQLFTLRHLASIARSTQPAKEGGTAGYQALREFSFALDHLSSVNASRLHRDTSSTEEQSRYGSVSGAGGRADENERLLTRLRDRLRRLKRGGSEQPLHATPPRPNKLTKAPPRDLVPKDSIAARSTQQLPRTERVLSANDHEDEIEELGTVASGNHVEVDGARWSMVRRDPVERERVPTYWRANERRGMNAADETAYLPVLRS
ncbi:uncharacterized protein JCM15063_001256 [Sporobolomyces koalae]|uniref:uncharacterized protein n=1 Tax=Sporobolomyces koalae TaxID=500713 RepID=UPI0031824107